MSARSLFRALCPLIAIAMLPLRSLAAPGDLMSVTSTVKMQMTGMPAQYTKMPPRTFTQKECIAGDQQLRDPQRWVEESDCTASDVRNSPAGVSAHMVCGQITADIHIDLLPGGGAHGTIHTSGTAGQGMHMVGDQTFDARRIGSCDYQPGH